MDHLDQGGPKMGFFVEHVILAPCGAVIEVAQDGANIRVVRKFNQMVYRNVIKPICLSRPTLVGHLGHLGTRIEVLGF